MNTTGGTIGSTAVVSSNVIADAVHLACRAPSIHNSQPWRFVAAGGGLLHLHLDRDRFVDSDTSGRQSILSCGAVLHHLKVAMAAAGWMADVDYFPNPNDPDHLATIEFGPMTFVTAAHRRAADAILSRRTDRLPFGTPAHWSAFEPLLRQAVGVDRALLDILPEDSRSRLAEASQLTDSLRLYDSAYHAELAWWTGPFVTTDGIPHSSLVSAAESDRVDIGRTFPVTHHADRRPQLPEDRSTVVLLSALGDDRRDILACGEALSAALLEATMAGLATCPLTHMTEVEVSRKIICELSGRALPQVLIRMGVVPASEDAPSPTARRPLNEVLSYSMRGTVHDDPSKPRRLDSRLP